MPKTDIPYEELATELRLYYAHYLKAAKAILLGEFVNDEDWDLVRELSSDKEWFYRHCISPCDFIGVEPDDEMSSALKRYGDVGKEDTDASLVEECEFVGNDFEAYYPDSSLRHFSRVKEMRAFGITDEDVCDEEFEIVKSIWEGSPIGDDPCSWMLEKALDALIGAKVKSLEDFNHISELLEKAIDSFKGDVKQIRGLRWRLADCYYIMERMGEALTLYQDILSVSVRGFETRPVLACQIINIKMKSGLRVEARDIMMLPKLSEYKLTMNEFLSLLNKTRRFLDVKLAGMMSHGLNLKNVMKEAKKGRCPHSCFYRMGSALKCVRRFRKNPTFPNIDPESESLKEVLLDLFGEMRFLGKQILDVRGIEDDWVEDTKLYYRLVETFPHEEIIHHYRTAWLWKYQIAIYFPRLKLALDYRGRAVLDSKNFTKHSGGKDEYSRFYDRTMKKAMLKYGIHVEVIGAETTWDTIVDIVVSSVEKNLDFQYGL